MKKVQWLIIIGVCVILAVAITGCCDKSEARFSPEQVDIWYKMSLADTYEMFEANFGNVISEEEYLELQSIYKQGEEYLSEVCVVHTFEDGTMVLLRLKTDDFEDYSIKDIEFLGEN